MQSIVSTSPDGKHHAILEYRGEIRFGPAYYSLTVDTIRFGERVFGNSFLWSPTSRFLAIQEWETISESHGPGTHLLLLDLDAKRECVLSWAEKGFIVPKSFEHDKLIYTKEYFTPPVTREFEIEFLPLRRWEHLK
jgi:hypothetical protein